MQLITLALFQVLPSANEKRTLDQAWIVRVYFRRKIRELHLSALLIDLIKAKKDFFKDDALLDRRDLLRNLTFEQEFR